MSILESMNIGSNALRAHGLRLDIHAKNIANIDTPNYVRRIPVLNASEDISFHGLMNTMKNDVFGTGTLPYLFDLRMLSTTASTVVPLTLALGLKITR